MSPSIPAATATLPPPATSSREGYLSPMAAAIAATRSELLVQVADTPALVRDAHLLRHQVYCTERGYEPGQDGLEFDAHDDHAAHVVVRLRACGTVIGTARLILPHADGSESFPMQGVVLPGRFAALPFLQTAEVSRFAVSKERRGLSPAAASLSRLALVRGLVQLSRQRGVSHWCAVMERTLLRLLRASGIHFADMGPMVEYHGLRQPAWCELAGMLARMQAEQPEIWGFVTEHGAFAPMVPAPRMWAARRAA